MADLRYLNVLYSFSIAIEPWGNLAAESLEAFPAEDLDQVAERIPVVDRSPEAVQNLREEIPGVAGGRNQEVRIPVARHIQPEKEAVARAVLKEVPEAVEGLVLVAVPASKGSLGTHHSKVPCHS